MIHPDPDPAAINLCRDLAAETDAEAVVLFGSRAAGGWDEQSDLDMIIVHPAAAEDDRRKVLGQTLARLRERHYPGHGDYDSPHHGVADGLMVETPQNYHACSRTLNHVIARAAREGRILTKGSPGRGRLSPRRRRLQRVGAGDPGAPQARGPGSTATSSCCGTISPGTPKATRPLADTASMSTPTRGETPTSCCGTRERRSCLPWASSTPGTRWRR